MVAHNKIKAWLRQARHRAKHSGVVNATDLQAVIAIVEDCAGACVYCGLVATTMDHPFPLCASAPLVPANVVPSCAACRKAKGNMDLVQYHATDHITDARYVAIIKAALARQGGAAIEAHIRSITGIGL